MVCVCIINANIPSIFDFEYGKVCVFKFAMVREALIKIISGKKLVEMIFLEIF